MMGIEGLLKKRGSYCKGQWPSNDWNRKWPSKLRLIIEIEGLSKERGSDFIEQVPFNLRLMIGIEGLYKERCL